MKKRTTKALILVLTIALIMGTLMIPASATPSASDFKAFPFQDGVMLTWTGNSIAWCEISLFEEEPQLPESFGFWDVYNLGHRLSRVNNNACSNAAFINEDSAFDGGVSFTNTPGKTYYFYVVAYDGEWAYLDKVVYTVPADPTLEVASEGLVNTLSYTLANNGNGGAIYRYDSKEKAEAGGNDYDKKIDVAYGGEPVKDTVDAEGSYYYVVKQDMAQAFAPANGGTSNNGATNVKIKMDLTGATFTFEHPEGAAWTILDVYTNDVNTDENASTAYKELYERLSHEVEGITNSDGALNTSCRFTFGGTTAMELLTNGKLMPGQTYTFQLISYINGAFASSHITFTVPMLASGAVQEAKNAIQDQPTEKPTEDSTENPTEKPTEQPTENPTTDPVDPPASTADLSVMIYVVAVFAAAAVIAIFALRKRNCKQGGR